MIAYKKNTAASKLANRAHADAMSAQNESSDPLSKSLVDLLVDDKQIFLLFNLKKNTVIWTSVSIEPVFGLSKTVSRLEDFQPLYQLVATNVFQKNISLSNHWLTVGTIKQVSSDVEYFDIEIKAATHQQPAAWIKMGRRSVADKSLKAILEEQENLFNISKTISIGEMATTLAHEINQPLGTISNMISGSKKMLKRSLDSAAELEREGRSDELDPKHNATLSDLLKALETVDRQSKYIHSVIDRMRSFAGQRAPKKELVFINEIINETIELSTWLFESQATQVTCRFDKHPLSVKVDKTLITQVLLNVYRNAIDAMRQNAVDARMITIRLFKQEGDAKIEITDRGHGIDDKETDEIFKPFSSTKSDGMGIGLNICRSFIELHNGRLWISSHKPQGCTVHMMLPLVET